MRFVTFQHQKHRHPGVALHDRIVSLSEAGFPALLSVLQGGIAARNRIDTFLLNPPSTAVFATDEVKLCAPLPNPPKILCVGLNYRDHAQEAGMPIPAFPTIFAKFSNTVIATGDSIILPRNSDKPDYEAELAFVIGKTARRVNAADWREYVFGYTIFNDVSARDVQLAVSQWTMGKNFDTFGPMGPSLVTADEIADPHDLAISLIVDGEIRQQSNTRELIFKIPALIEFLSGIMTLEAGDIIATGTPAGVGLAHNPPKWLTPGAEVVVTIQGIGELRNGCVSET